MTRTRVPLLALALALARLHPGRGPGAGRQQARRPRRRRRARCRSPGAIWCWRWTWPAPWPPPARRSWVRPRRWTTRTTSRSPRMASEGSEVKKGAKVLHFDVGEFERELLERTAERDSAAREIERKRHEIELQRKESELRVTEAEALARKAELKADLPEKYTAAVEMKLARIDLEAAQAELRMAKQRYQHVLRLGQAELAYLRDRHARFASRVARLEEAIDKMAVVDAPRRGGGLPEQLAGREEEGGRRLLGGRALPGGHRHQGDGGPGRGGRGGQSPGWRWGRRCGCGWRRCPSSSGRAPWPRLRPNVYRQSPRNPLKVMGVQIKLDKTDASRMRPGMQFRGRLETGAHRRGACWCR